MHREILASVVLHLGAVLVMLLSEGCIRSTPPPPPIAMVTAVSSPVKKAKRVNRASKKQESSKSSKSLERIRPCTALSL